MASSDYDARHAINANAVIELPVGKGKAFFSNAPKLVDGIIGGWQVSTLFNFHTGNPVQCIASYQYNTNYDRESLCMLAPGVKGTPSSKLQFDQLGIPSMFANTNAGSDFVPAYSGYVGDRNSLRGFHYWNDDMSISKVFKVSEGKQVSFRVEAYNLTNTVTFANPTISIYQATGTTSAGGPAAFGSATFGETTKTLPTASPRVLQMALRFAF